VLRIALGQNKDVLRDITIEILSSKQVEQIVTRDGKEKLKDDIVNALNRV